MWNNRIVRYSEEAPDQLLANPRNYRTHPGSQAEALRGVLGSVGIVQNVIANERTGYLIDGHLRVMEALKARGVSTHALTLHVGAGTFLPVKADDTADHRMHSEWGVVSTDTAAALNAVRAAGGRIVCVGTTSLRLLESATTPEGEILPFQGDTAIFITPGYRFRAVDVLMTNFHLPKSTLFMLVSAFAGLETMKAAYAHAVADGYRFYSYGDGSLLFRAA
jgi:S-adenosylmethionine:tRNA ribosyltransferase-isomerase